MKKIITIIFILITISCQSDRKIDFHLYNNLPIIKAHINGIPVKLLVDTGASVSLIDTTTENTLLFSKDLNIPISIGQGMGGHAYLYGIKDVVLEYNGDVLDVNFKGVDLSNIRQDVGIVGIVGSDFLSKNNLVIDYYNRNIKVGTLDVLE